MRHPGPIACLAWAAAACGTGDPGGTTDGPEAADTDASGGGDGGDGPVPVDVDSGRPDSGVAAAPTWLSWEGEDVLTVDVFADGDVECVFRWRTSGILAAEPCPDCAFDFEVRAVPDAASTCGGATAHLGRRWAVDDVLMVDGQAMDSLRVVDGELVARWSTLTVDETYGAPVASTLDVTATLR